MIVLVGLFTCLALAAFVAWCGSVEDAGAYCLAFIAMALVCLTLTEPNKPEVPLALTGHEVKFMKLFEDSYKASEIEFLYGSITSTRDVNNKPTLPFCDVPRVVVSMTVEQGKPRLSDKLNLLYGTEWHKCMSPKHLRASPILQNQEPKANPMVLEELENLLSDATLSELTAVVNVCNIAKIKVISGGVRLTEKYAQSLIKQCKIFKLQQELQQ